MKTLIFLLLLVPATSLAQEFARIESQLLAEVNAERAKKHRKPLVYEVKYQSATDTWSQRIVKDFNHNHGAPYHSEVITKVFSQDRIVPSFMESEPHKKALMDKEVTRICISVYEAIDPKQKLPMVFTVMRTYR